MSYNGDLYLKIYMSRKESRELITTKIKKTEAPKTTL